MKRSDNQLYHEAYQKELQALKENHVFTMVPASQVPEGTNILRTVTTFKRKHDADGNFVKLKARICVDGSIQQEGVDYYESYAPVAQTTTMRTLLSYAVKNKLHVHSIDVKTAFLNGHLEETVYMHPPDLVNDKDPASGEKLVCKLQKALYGLKQAPRSWYDKLDSALASLGLIRSKVDACLYKHNSKKLWLSFHVDDFLLLGSSKKEIQDIINALSKHFDLEDFGPATEYLGLSIARDWAAQTITISQERYTESLLEKYNMSRAN